MTAQEIAAVEDLANDIVLENTPVETRLMGVEDAKQSGARALFGEKYGDEVRVVSMGLPTGNGLGWSVELCGGTHVRRTGDIGLITVVGESAVASGVRRIEALTATHARHHARANAGVVAGAASQLKAGPQEVLERIEALQAESRRNERALAEARQKLALQPTGDMLSASGGGVGEMVGQIRFLGRSVEGIEAKSLRSLVDVEKKRVGSGVVALVLKSEDGKGTVAVGVTNDLTGRVSAAELVKLGTAALGGQGGGGRPDMAQGGGPDGTRAGEAVAAIKAGLERV
jgi:alanyl-tRNA synthetase